MKVTIYTDGACSCNPGPGGYGVVLMFEDNVKEISGYFPNTTNNRMEMMAVIKGLEALKFPCEVTLYSDSAYVVNAINQSWIKKWEKAGWKKANSEIKNIDLWKEILILLKKHKVEFVKVKGHSDNQYNNRCDELATWAIKNHK